MRRSPIRSETARTVRPRRPRTPYARWRWAAALYVLLLGVGLAQAEPVAVVVHPAVEIDGLSFAEFRKIILADRQFWSAGKRITLIVRAPVADERTLLLDRVYKMSEAQYRRYWVAKVFRAEVTSGPRVVISNEEAVDLVSVVDGAIAVVNEEDVPEGLKVLKIDGQLPGEPGYPFN